MTRKCELCVTPERRVTAAKLPPKPSKPRRISIEDRVIVLCQAHAEQVRKRAPGTLAELRQAFPEPRGQRALLERRAALDRRAFPARPEGRRASSGRRATDRAE